MFFCYFALQIYTLFIKFFIEKENTSFFNDFFNKLRFNDTQVAVAGGHGFIVAGIEFLHSTKRIAAIGSTDEAHRQPFGNNASQRDVDIRQGFRRGAAPYYRIGCG